MERSSFQSILFCFEAFAQNQQMRSLTRRERSIDRFGGFPCYCEPMMAPEKSAKEISKVGWVEPFAKPISRLNMMGIASLNPSYPLRRLVMAVTLAFPRWRHAERARSSCRPDQGSWKFVQHLRAWWVRDPPGRRPQVFGHELRQL